MDVNLWSSVLMMGATESCTHYFKISEPDNLTLIYIKNT